MSCCVGENLSLYVDDATLNYGVRIDGFDGRKDAWRTIDGKSHECVSERIPKEAQIIGYSLPAFGISNTEPKNFRQYVFVVHEKNLSSREMVPIDHDILRLLIILVNVMESITIESCLNISANDVLFLS